MDSLHRQDSGARRRAVLESLAEGVGVFTAISGAAVPVLFGWLLAMAALGVPVATVRVPACWAMAAVLVCNGLAHIVLPAALDRLAGQQPGWRA